MYAILLLSPELQKFLCFLWQAYLLFLPFFLFTIDQFWLVLLLGVEESMHQQYFKSFVLIQQNQASFLFSETAVYSIVKFKLCLMLVY